LIADLGGGFGEFEGRAWLKTAHQGALPLVAGQEALEAISWNTSPRQMTLERFRDVPARVRRAVGALLNVSPSEVVLSNSASGTTSLNRTNWPKRSRIRRACSVRLGFIPSPATPPTFDALALFVVLAESFLSSMPPKASERCLAPRRGADLAPGLQYARRHRPSPRDSRLLCGSIARLARTGHPSPAPNRRRINAISGRVPLSPFVPWIV